MLGLREIWNLGDPTPLDPDVARRIEAIRQGFVDAVSTINVSLRYTTAHSPEPQHTNLASRRDRLLARYQEALSLGATQPDAIERLAAEAGGLSDDASRLVESTREAKRRWDQRSASLEASEDAIAAAGDDEEEVLQLKQAVDRATKAASERDYLTACDELDATGQVGAVVNERKFPLLGKVDPAPTAPANRDELEGWRNPLVSVEPEELFTPDRMDEVVNMHFAGEEGEQHERLNAAMESLLFPKPGDDPQEHLRVIGEVRGITDPQVLQEQYERFRQLQQVSQGMEQTRELEHDDTYDNNGADFLDKHPDFLGSRSNLRFGQVVGEATGLDPAFAAMLNPTGGMVGPGMDHFAPTDADSPVVWHGIFHDAGGYLFNHQNSGPGYTYLEDKRPESGREGSHPWQGQIEGVSYWYERSCGDDQIFDDLLSGDKTQPAYDAYVRDPIENAEEAARSLTQEVVDDVAHLASTIRDRSRQTAENLKSGTSAVADGVGAAVTAADKAVDALADLAREAGLDAETVDTAEKTIDEQLAAVGQQVADWDRSVSAAIDQAAAAVEEELDDVESWTRQAGTAVQDKAAEMADDTEQAVRDELVDLVQSEKVQDALRQGVNFYAEASADFDELKREVAGRVDRAAEVAADLLERTAATLRSAAEAGGDRLAQAERQLAAARDSLTDKLNQVRDTALDGIDQVAEGLGDAGRGLQSSAQDIRDTAAGVADDLEDAVDAGTDALANVANSATDFAATSLDSLTNLLG